MGEDAQWKEVIPREQRNLIIKNNHDVPTSGHLGIFKTFHRLAEQYTWPKMTSDVTRYVNKCVTCMKSKPEQKAPAGRMGGHSQITRPWEVVCTDIIGPLPRSSQNYNYVFVVADVFSKFCLCFPLRKATANNVIKHLVNDVFLVYGVPRTIISDNGVQFRSHQYKKFLENYKVQPSFTSFYNPQANPTERINRLYLYPTYQTIRKIGINFYRKRLVLFVLQKVKQQGLPPIS